MAENTNGMIVTQEYAAIRKRPRTSSAGTSSGPATDVDETTMAADPRPNPLGAPTIYHADQNDRNPDHPSMVALPPPMDEQLMRQELLRMEAEHRTNQRPGNAGSRQHYREIIEQQPPPHFPPIQPPRLPQCVFQTTMKRKTANPTSHTSKRTLPPHLIVLYQELKDHEIRTQQNQQATKDAEEELAAAQRRFEACQQEASLLKRNKDRLEQQVLDAELQLDNDFTHHYRQLVQFQEKFGHCNVPASPVGKSNKPGNSNSISSSSEFQDLALWVKKMRRVKQMRASSKGDYYQGAHWHYYMFALDKLGFVWDAVQDQWRNQFEKMLSFKASTGHCAVPKAYAPDKSLGAWVHRQRYHYKLYHEGKPTQLTRERIDLLTSVGFSWGSDATSKDRNAFPQPTKPRKGKPTRTPEEEWEHKFQQLVAFRRHYGHVKVSAMDDKNRDNQLRDWVAWQRREYKLWKRGEPSHVTSEHVQRLSEIGFDWELTGPRKSTSSNGEDRGISRSNSSNYDVTTPRVTRTPILPVDDGSMRGMGGGIHGDGQILGTKRAITTVPATANVFPTPLMFPNHHHHHIGVDPFRPGRAGQTPDAFEGNTIDGETVPEIPGPHATGGISALSY